MTPAFSTRHQNDSIGLTDPASRKWELSNPSDGYVQRGQDLLRAEKRQKEHLIAKTSRKRDSHHRENEIEGPPLS